MRRHSLIYVQWHSVTVFTSTWNRPDRKDCETEERVSVDFRKSVANSSHAFPRYDCWPVKGVGQHSERQLGRPQIGLVLYKKSITGDFGPNVGLNNKEEMQL